MEALTILSNDWHLKSTNIAEIKDLARQKLELAKKLNVETVFILGDIFDSRTSQRLDVLTAFSDILDMFDNAGMQVIAIPGNHDKTRYDSIDSFLDPFAYHPNVYIIHNYRSVMVKGQRFHLLPFMENEQLLEIINNILVREGDILLGHFAVNGSVNLNGTKVESVVKPIHFVEFKQVFLGHYHNPHQVASNIFHCPSIKQSNYGETPEKGFTVINLDCSYYIHNAKFRTYNTVQINLDTTTNDELEVLLETYDGCEDNVRFVFTGADAKLKSLDKGRFTNAGIDVKVKYQGYLSVDSEEGFEIKQYDKDELLAEFDIFCSTENLEKEKGEKYLLPTIEQYYGKRIRRCIKQD